MKKTLLIACMALATAGLSAQQVLTVEECRDMAVQNNKSLQQSAIKVEMAECDKGIARANYFPNISAKAAYLYNDQNIALISDNASTVLQNAGTAVQQTLAGQMNQLTQAIMSNPAAAAEYMSSPMWQTVIGALSKADVSGAINQIGSQVDDALHLDIKNVYVAAVSVTQPVFVGGKVIAANRIASLAAELAQSQYDTEYQQLLVEVDQSYWQVVSIAAKKALAQNYVDLLTKMEHDAQVSVDAGVADESDLLSVKVKANEAKMMLAKSTSGLSVAKMLLCKQIGLPLNSDIKLADEGGDCVPMPQMTAPKSMDEVYADRAEIRSLELASEIYDNKVKVVRADMMPTVALTANYLVSNPSVNNGFRNEFAGRFSAGVVVSVPISHGFEAGYKTRKAKAEATYYHTKYDDAKNLISLEISKLTMEQEEAYDRLAMAESNLSSAEENLRKASIGFEEGVIASNVAMAAHTAWLQAHSEYIDAGIEVQMTNANLQRAQGNYKPEN